MPLTREARQLLKELEKGGVRVVLVKTPDLVKKCDMILTGCKKPLVIVHVTC